MHILTYAHMQAIETSTLTRDLCDLYVQMYCYMRMYTRIYAYKHIQPSPVGAYLPMYIHFNCYNFVCLCKVEVYSWEETWRIQ